MTLGAHHGGPALPEARLEGRTQFQQLVREALACAAREGWREIILCDPDFEDWPLGEREVSDSLMAWSRPGRRITLVAQRWDRVLRHHARFVIWRRTWSSIVEARGLRSADPADVPSAIWAPGWILQRHDTERSLGVATHDAGRRHQLHEVLRAAIGKSAPAFPASTLGL